jgi:hypothetical protein
MSTAALDQRPASAWEQAQQRFACEHRSYRLAFKVAKGGARHYRLQCLHCGESIRMLAKGDLTAGEIASAQPFDDARLKDFRDRRSAYWRSLVNRERLDLAEQRDREARKWRRRYNRHVSPDNPKWQSLRRRVFNRSGGICEGCGIRRAVQVHHLTYEHLGDEFLWELRAVCLQCHERIHADHEEQDL